MTDNNTFEPADGIRRSSFEDAGDYLPETPIADNANSAERLGSGAVPMSSLPEAVATQGGSPAEREGVLDASSVAAPLLAAAPELVGSVDPVQAEERITNKTVLILKRLLRNKGAVLGLIMLAAITLFALVGNMGRPFTYHDQDVLNLGSPPGTDGHILGTNSGGIDLWAMLVHGTGKSLLIAAFVGIGAPLIGAVYGTAIAFWGGRREKAGMWILDMLILMPYFLIVAVFMGSTGGSAVILALLLTAFGWMGLARVIRATTASLREREFVKAAQYMGVSDWNIIRRHIIPNIGSLLIINIITGTYGAIISETALSFLGVGVRAPDVSLGSLIGQSASQLYAYPWMFWGPALCLVMITFSLALIGDGLRDALDPNSKSGGRA
ncbi:ABC transporter permease [Mobilicoccus pelagius]|uniref:Oligopeptide transport system permease protein OppC n=1 Tax=Mobilicoccus pelagius NBRC 104925 TaxID=1089455 RepID=H5UTZ7_9MICO|nr:ABC transporter permease [Mobilicoccus pelagius]GAB49205.1 putative ABC transporter permease protein [Mobilicoccus pelagius NBRC 104925]